MTDRVIPPPDPDRPPLKTNVYWFAQTAPTALAPLFPYFDEGAIVPCVATFRGGPGKNYARFQHFNTVDEVFVMFGGAGQLNRGSGLVRVGPKLHMVQGPLQDPDDADSMGVSVITQRQSIGKEQREEVRFVCEKCDRRLFVQEYDATPPRRGTSKGEGATTFLTILESFAAAKRFNEDAAARICKHCGHENPPFPIETWGWDVYANQAEIARRSLDAMQAARAPAPPRSGGAEGEHRHGA